MTTYVSYFYSFNVLAITSNPIFRDFETTFSSQVISPNDLIIKEQIGEGEHCIK